VPLTPLMIHNITKPRISLKKYNGTSGFGVFENTSQKPKAMSVIAPEIISPRILDEDQGSGWPPARAVGPTQ
jgi:hypothetical protein